MAGQACHYPYNYTTIRLSNRPTGQSERRKLYIYTTIPVADSGGTKEDTCPFPPPPPPPIKKRGRGRGKRKIEKRSKRRGKKERGRERGENRGKRRIMSRGTTERGMVL